MARARRVEIVERPDGRHGGGPDVRLAEPADAGQLARLRWAFRPGHTTGRSFDGFAQDFDAWLGDALASDWTAAVADEGDGTLVGCVFLRSVDKVPNPGAPRRAWGYVTNAYVDPGRRGRGLGGRLLERVVTVARERGHEFLLVWPDPQALSFYARAGFRAVGEAHAGADDHPPLEFVL